MKRLSAFIIFCMLLVSCDFLIDDSVFEGDKGNLILVLRDQGVATDRILEPAVSMDIHSYDINGVGPMGASFTESNFMNSNYTRNDLSTGIWNITVDARNINGKLIGQGETSVNIAKDYTSTADVPLSPLSGYGTVDFTVTWPDGSISTPVIVASFSDTPGELSTVIFNVYGNSASFYNEYAVGYYELNIALLDGDIIVWSFSDDVRIVKSENTYKEFNIDSFEPSDKGTIDLTIDTNMENPLDITLTGTETSLTPGTDMTIYADVSEVPDSYQWYLNGEILYGETSSSITIGSALDLGSHRLTLIVQKGDILSSEGFNFVINQLIYMDVTLDVEVYSGTYGSEVSWYIVDSNGNEVATSEYYTSYNYYYTELVLSPGQYTIYGADSYGDGWNGGYVTITSNGVPVLDQFTFTSGSYGQADFTVGNIDFDVVGEWTLYFDWAPTDTYYSVSMTLHADNTFDTGGSYAGVWSLIGDQLVLTYDNGTEYTGTVQGSNYASGTIIGYDGSPGIWYADR